MRGKSGVQRERRVLTKIIFKYTEYPLRCCLQGPNKISRLDLRRKISAERYSWAVLSRSVMYNSLQSHGL